MTEVSLPLLVIILNVNGLHDPIKRQRLAKRIKIRGPTICGLQETHFKSKDTNSLKVKGLKKIIHANKWPKESSSGYTNIRQDRRAQDSIHVTWSPSLPLFFFFFSISFLLGITKCSRLILDLPCPSPGSSRFSEELWFITVGNGEQRSKSRLMVCSSIFAFCGQSKWIHRHTNIHTCIYMHAYIWAHTPVYTHIPKYLGNHKITPVTPIPIYLHRFSLAFPHSIFVCLFP